MSKFISMEKIGKKIGMSRAGVVYNISSGNIPEKFIKRIEKNNKIYILIDEKFLEYDKFKLHNKLTINDLSEILKLNTSNVYNLIRKNKIKYSKYRGKILIEKENCKILFDNLCEKTIEKIKKDREEYNRVLKTLNEFLGK